MSKYKLFFSFGKFKCKTFLLREKINNNPNLKNAIEQNISKQGIFYYQELILLYLMVL